MYKVTSKDIERRVWKEIRQEKKERKEHEKRVAAIKANKAGGKEVQVKSYTRKTKSGKTVTVKAHTAKRKVAMPTPSSGGAKAPSGAELERQKYEKAYNEVLAKGRELLDLATEYDLEYKRGKTHFDTLVNAVTALCLPKKGGYGLDDSVKNPIENVVRVVDSFLSISDFPKALRGAVKKKLGTKISKVSPNIRAELNRVKTPVTFDIHKARGLVREAVVSGARQHFWKDEMHKSASQRERFREGLLKKY